MVDDTPYTTHKKIVNSLGYRGYEPYAAIIRIGRCKGTTAYKSAKLILIYRAAAVFITQTTMLIGIPPCCY